MAHGTPDWGVTAGRTTVYQLTDMGELAARLGSIVTFDRRGDVIWLDDFESGRRGWSAILSGAGAAADISLVAARSGAASCRLVSGTDAGKSATIAHRDRLPVSAGLGMEASFALGDHIGNLTFVYQAYDGVNVTDWRVKWSDTDRKLAYRDADLNYVTLATGVDIFVNATLFNTVKMALDAASGEYARIIFNSATYALPGVAARVTADATEPQIRVEVGLGGVEGFNNKVYLDDVILTQNEPL